MTDQTTTDAAPEADANQMPAGADAIVDATELHTEASTWLENARVQIKIAVQYIDAHWQAFEDKVKAEAAAATAATAATAS